MVFLALCVIVASFTCQQRVLETFPGHGYLHSKNGGTATMVFIDTFVYIVHYFILLWLNLFGRRVDRVGWWFSYSVGVIVGDLVVSRGC